MSASGAAGRHPRRPAYARACRTVANTGTYRRPASATAHPVGLIAPAAEPQHHRAPAAPAHPVRVEGWAGQRHATVKEPLPDAAAGSVETVRPMYGRALLDLKVNLEVKV